MKLNNTLKSALSLLLALTLLVSLANCGGNNETSNDACSNDTTDNENGYTVTVISDTGALIKDVTVFVYSDGTLADLVAVERTDEDGKVNFDIPEKDGYIAVLSEVPEGYAWEENYPIAGKTTEIVLTTVLPEDADKVYGKGDLMYNFNLTDINGNTHKLSDLIKTKKAVVLNFWFIGCNPCAIEFPYLNEAYEQYKDKIEVIAINPLDESVEDVKEYAKEKGLTMPVVSEKIDWQTRMDIGAYPTTVVIDRHGRICLVHQGYITSTEEFAKVFAYFSADDYKQTLLNGIGDIDSSEESGEESGNPSEIGGVTEFEMTVEAGETEYCDVYKISNMNLTVDSPNAVIIYNGEEYAAKDGVVNLYVVAEDTFTPIKLGISNRGDKKETFKIVFTHPLGSSGNPHTLTLGELETTVSEGNDQGVFYKYVAESSGILTLECISATDGIGYDYVLYNLDSYAQRSMSEDGEEGENSVSINVKKGQTVTVTIGTTPDGSGKYPAATFTSKATFEEKEDVGGSMDELTEYSVTVKDKEGKAVKGVNVTFNADGEIVTAKTDESGFASTKLSAVSCKVIITVPAGYTAEETEFSLSADNSAMTVSITKDAVVMADYTVTVKDKDGKAIKGVLVTVGESFVHTDANGKATFTLPKGDYTATISVPEGYTADKTSIPFPAGKTTLSVTIKKGSEQGSGGTQKITYSVTVKKPDGSAVSGVAVVFEKNGVSAAVQTTGSDGIATTSLEKGSYIAKLAFASGINLNYDRSSTKLSENKSSITVTVAEPVSDETTELYLGMAHHLSLGGNYCKLDQTEETTYFVFAPEKSGVYSFTTSYSNTKISYWGANTNFIFDQTSSTDYKNNLFTLNVKEGNLGAVYIIGVTGETDAVVIVNRTGNAVLGIEDLPWTVYKAQKTPTPFSLGTAKFTASYFDVTGKTDDYKLVYNSADGLYHLGDKNGKVVYVMLGESAPYLSFAKLVETTGLKKYFYDTKGNFVKKEDYTECMMAFAANMDEKTGLYPLTDDLMYIIKQSGDFAGWWDKNSAGYLFSSLTNVNTDIAWMFALCTVTTN